MIVIVIAAWLIIIRIQRRYKQKMYELVSEIEKLRSNVDQHHIPNEQNTKTDTYSDGDNHNNHDETTNSEDRLFLMNVIEVANVAMIKGKISVEQVASDMNLGVQSFRRRIQNITGETPKEYITAIQMERAVNLLTESPEMPLSKVAELCGFEDTSSFGHTFKRIYGCSPSQYRRQQ